MTHTHTYAVLEISPKAFAEIKQRLEAAGYGDAFDATDGKMVIDMHGLALSPAFKTIQGIYQEKCDTPSDINQHLPTLRAYAEKCLHVTEMGVRTIVSTWAFLAAKPLKLVSIDYIHPKEHGGNMDELLELVAHEGRDFKFVKGDTRTIDIDETDLLFIDTWHVYEQLKIELERHAPKVKKFIILHDTETFGLRGETDGHPGLRPALIEFMAHGEGLKWATEEVFTNCNGLTVLKRVQA